MALLHKYKRLVSNIPFAFISVLLVSLFNGQAQPPNLQFKHITTADGLSSSSVTSILQDSRGYMWIGTYNGLNCFNGIDFTHYSYNNKKPSSLLDNYIFTLFESSSKELYIGSSGGLSKYNCLTDDFFNYHADSSSALFNTHNNIKAIAEDKDNNLWLGGDDGLICFNPGNNTADFYLHKPNDTTSISNNIVEDIMIDYLGRTWIATGNGLNLFEPITRTFRRFLYHPYPVDGKSSTGLSCLAQTHDSLIWIGSYGSGLYRFDFRSGQGPEIKIFKHQDPNHSISADRVMSLYVDKENRLWIGTENKGLNLYDRMNNRFVHYRHDEYNPRSLNQETINAIYTDHIGNMWLGTFKGGINFSNIHNQAVVYSNHVSDKNQRIKIGAVTGFLENRTEEIWITTDGNGLLYYNTKTQAIKSFKVKNSGLISNNILSIVKEDEQTVWLGSWEGGISKFNPKNETIVNYTEGNSGLPDDNIFSIVSTKGHLWMGSFQKGLIGLDKRTGHFSSYNTENSKLTHNIVNVVVEGPKNQIYVGTVNGLNIFNPENGTLKYHLKSPDEPNSLSNNYINDILIEKDTSVWIATKFGLSHFNPQTEVFTKYLIDGELPTNGLNSLVLDSLNRLWIGTLSGIVVFNTKLRIVERWMDQYDGLVADEMNSRSSLILSDGRILFGSINGFSLIDPAKITVNKLVPKIRITDIHIFNEPVYAGSEGSPLNIHISEAKSITLNHEQSVLTFFFNVMDFTIPEKNQYAYMLEGFDKDWVYSGNKREVTYTNLNPDKYTLHVKGANNDGVWNEEGTSLEIIITPPWWKTWWSKAILVILVILAVFGIVAMRNRKLSEQKRKLQKLVHERTLQIEEKNRKLIEKTQELEKNTKLLTLSNSQLQEANATKDKFLSIIAHDLKNPIGSIMGFIELLKNNYNKITDEKRVTWINLIHQSSIQLNKLVENTLYWTRTQMGRIKFEPTAFDLSELINANIDLIRNQASDKLNSLKVEADDYFEIRADKNMLDTTIRNLLSNANKFTENGEIKISALKKDKKVIIKVSDTGVGIPQEEIDSLFNISQSKTTVGTKGEKGTGFGLLICKEFIDLHGGTIMVNSIENKHTSFEIVLPQ
jgi:signal transduction histidine kinase/ligand-binding sensor domain-containing protein